MFDNRNILLYPVSLIYGLITGTRNFLYSAGVLKSYSFDLPVICIGNITIGGTGKTPHTEYVAGLLKDSYNVAVLSRGYKRKTKGFIIASPVSTAHDIGDEPLQIYSRFPGITVAVDSDRVRGLQRILEERPETDVVILDDGFQHRRLTPGFSILLSDYNRPLPKDHLIPFGSLREHRRNAARADVLIITKTPEDITPIDRRLITDRTDKYPYQTLLFSALKYGQPMPVYKGTVSEFKLDWNSFQDNGALIVTGIASPEPLVTHVKRFFSEVRHLRFPDHHDFTESDLYRIGEAWKGIEKPHKYIITTEKDAVRLREFTNIADDLKNAFFFIPVSISFLNKGRDDFDKLVSSYVGKNRRNKRLPV
jgi:tetraacyldisaccharide 4'-kinase